MVGIGLGTVVVAAFVFFVCVAVVAPNGRFDFLTELYIKCRKGDSAPLNQLRKDCIACAAGTDVDDPCFAGISSDDEGKPATVTDDDHSRVSAADNMLNMLEDDITVQKAAIKKELL